MTEISSKKHPVLEYIFKKYYNPRDPQKVIVFYLSDISEGYKATNQAEPVSISNTILDLTRQDRGINSRLPKSVSEFGYDLRKKTGVSDDGRKFAGEFVFVGKGKSLRSWIEWPAQMERFTVSTTNIPQIVRELIRQDEGALFSILDYTNLLSQIFHNGEREIHRIQNPMKWQPNEIDGFYGEIHEEILTVYPVEAKALTTGDEINLDQLQGGFRTVKEQLSSLKIDVNIVPVAMKMIPNGINIAIFSTNKVPEVACRYCQVVFEPPIINWSKK